MNAGEVFLTPEEDSKKRGLSLNHDTTVRLENNEESYTYKLAMILPDNNLVCKSISRALNENFAVGSMVNLVSGIEDGSCITPVQITAISHQAELVALKVMGKSQYVQRRMFARIKPGVGVQLKLQLDNHSSRYKSLEVSDLSVGGVGVIIYSKNPIATGHYAKLEIHLPMPGTNNRVIARGQIVHCSHKSQSRMAFLLGIKFVEISDRDQRKIIEYLSDLQDKDSEKDSCISFEYKPETQVDDSKENDSSTNVVAW